MKAYLYKLKEGWVLCSDEDFKSDDIVLVNNKYHTNELRKFTTAFGGTKEGCKKVLTQSPDLSSLSPDKQKEIGWFDVEKLADNFYRNYQQPPYVMEKGAWRLGFQKAQELLSDRRFTLEDMENAFYNGWIYRGEGYDFPRAKKEYLQQLSQPKSWEVLGIWENNKFKITQIIG